MSTHKHGQQAKKVTENDDLSHFETSLAALAQVPKSEVDELESARPKRPGPRRKALGKREEEGAR